MIKHGERAAVNSRLAGAVDLCLHKNICQTKHCTLYRRGQAGFAARTRGARRKFPTCWIYIMFTPISDSRPGRISTSWRWWKREWASAYCRFDIKARPVQNRNTPAGRAVLPLNRARNEKQKKPDSRSSKIYRISAVQGDGVNRLII